ncbi:MAG: hypothetical protein CL696_06320 [Chloroflexi bacterium]|jgi:hypothetical protein|nr:hypothetical protein [Chloroflexota bacterium]|tara:strand:+ start:2028 stop:2588 length:561 start_codon:yes stop_codon:yes gene_type:complete
MIAEGWKNELPESHRIALDVAYSDFLDAHFKISPTDSGKIEHIAGWLPKKFASRYTSLFCHRFIMCMGSVAERLVQPEKAAPAPRCTAEAFALHVLIQHATAILKDVQRIDADYTAFKDEAFRDTEFLGLYDADADVPGADLNKRVPLPNNLEFNDWFKPFDSLKPVNPFIYEDWTTEQAGINFYR